MPPKVATIHSEAAKALGVRQRAANVRPPPRCARDTVGMDFGALVLREGDHVAAFGRLTLNGDDTWFEPPLPVPAVLRRPRTVNPPWRGAIRVSGANLRQVHGRHEHLAAVEGYATLTGQWMGEGLNVIDQSAGGRRTDTDSAQWTSPPCPPPLGDWPHGPRDGNLAFDLADLRDTGAVVAITIFRPSPTQAVAVVAAENVEAVEQQLRPQLGQSLCIVPSRFSRVQLDRVRHELEQKWEAWDLYETGESHDEEGQPHISGSISRMLPETAEWASVHPSGLLAIHPWLAPNLDKPRGG